MLFTVRKVGFVYQRRRCQAATCAGGRRSFKTSFCCNCDGVITQLCDVAHRQCFESHKKAMDEKHKKMF